MDLQQDQTLAYFRSSAESWQEKAAGERPEYPVIAARHHAVTHLYREFGYQRLLDIGCGTGQLAIEAAADGLSALGVDFAQEMIDQCNANKAAAGSAAEFLCASALDLPADIGSCDILSAQGFIEYISLDDLTAFLRTCRELLVPGGMLALGSRNRLFNVVSLNAFTDIEETLGELNHLRREAEAIQGAPSQSDALLAISQFQRIQKQAEEHPGTGISVTTRYQFSPGDLATRVREAGFEPMRLYPVHYHALPVPMTAEHPKLHTSIASAVEAIDYPNHRILPRCSTFVMAARRP
jgi:2-polyprenyl-3-methyl-5-hydroxy-6-metoxy-1,4-benzoquinol methylase